MGDLIESSYKLRLRRKGATFKELKAVFERNITVSQIYEPIYCCKVTERTEVVKGDMATKNFDFIGVCCDEGNVIGYVSANELEGENISECYKEFSVDILTSEFTPLFDIFHILKERQSVYVLVRNSIEGIVTRADINKPLVRLYLFGMISLFEMHLNYWIAWYFDNNSWKESLNEERIRRVYDTYSKLKKDNLEMSLIECLQICDKRDILCKCNEFLKDFDYSKKNFIAAVKNVEKLRNNIAHSKDKIFSQEGWEKFILSIEHCENLLKISEGHLQVNL